VSTAVPSEVDLFVVGAGSGGVRAARMAAPHGAKSGRRVRLFTRNDHDRASRYPAIVTAAAAPQARSFLTDGEMVIAKAQGVASFALLRGRARENQAFVWAFDPLALECADLRDLPLEPRNGELKLLLKRAPFGLALKGVVSKRPSSRYRSGRSSHRRKAKNPESPAARREALEDWGPQTGRPWWVFHNSVRRASTCRLAFPPPQASRVGIRSRA
jgi:hypothetical protein